MEEEKFPRSGTLVKLTFSVMGDFNGTDSTELSKPQHCRAARGGTIDTKIKFTNKKS